MRATRAPTSVATRRPATGSRRTSESIVRRPEGVAYQRRTDNVTATPTSTHIHHVTRNAAATTTSTRVASGSVAPVSASSRVTCGTTHTSRNPSTADVVVNMTTG